MSLLRRSTQPMLGSTFQESVPIPRGSFDIATGADRPATQRLERMLRMPCCDCLRTIVPAFSKLQQANTFHISHESYGCTRGPRGDPGPRGCPGPCCRPVCGPSPHLFPNGKSPLGLHRLTDGTSVWKSFITGRRNRGFSSEVIECFISENYQLQWHPTKSPRARLLRSASSKSVHAMGSRTSFNRSQRPQKSN